MGAGKNHKICAVCGKRFPCPPSAKTVTCSKECSSIHRSKKHQGKRNQWTEQSRNNLHMRGQTVNLLKGTPAAQESPLAGRFPTNSNARHWILRSPVGVIHEFENLNLFIREHPEDFPNFQSARAALSAIARGKTRAIYYKGWSVEFRSELNNREAARQKAAEEIQIQEENSDEENH